MYLESSEISKSDKLMRHFSLLTNIKYYGYRCVETTKKDEMTQNKENEAKLMVFFVPL